MIKIKKVSLIIGLTLISAIGCRAQSVSVQTDKDAQYTQVITKRADKIVAALGITDSAKYKRVLKVIVNQYHSLNDIHDYRNNKVKELKQNTGIDKAAIEAKTKAIDDETEIKLNKQHQEYLSKLGADLNAEQIDKVKDAMTYNILPITYTAYLDEIPSLTAPQKAQIKTWLIEAREHAIDAESSEKKHAVFGKYKGRINNYLSAQGYDMKKEGEEWQKRIKAKQTNN